MDSERGLDRSGNLSGSSGENALGERFVEIAAGHKAKLRIRLGPAKQVLCHGGKGFAGGNTLKGCAGNVCVVEHHLPDAALFRCGEFVNPVFVGGFDLGFGDIDLVKKHLGVDGTNSSTSQSRCVIARFDFIEPLRQGRVFGRSNSISINGNRYKFGGAAFQLMRRQGARYRFRQLRAGGHGFNNLRPAQRCVDLVQIFRFAETGIRKDADKPGLGKIPQLVLKGRFVCHGKPLHVAGHSDTEVIRFRAENDVTG